LSKLFFTLSTFNFLLKNQKKLFIISKLDEIQGNERKFSETDFLSVEESFREIDEEAR